MTVGCLIEMLQQYPRGMPVQLAYGFKLKEIQQISPCIDIDTKEKFCTIYAEMNKEEKI